MRLFTFLGTCAVAAIALPAAAMAMQRGQDSDSRPIQQNFDRRSDTTDMRQDKARFDRFEASRVGTRIRQEDHPTHPDHPAHDPHDPHQATDPHHSTDPHDTIDPHDSTDPHDTIDPHHADPHHTEPH
jgi:hypothetical protein